MGKGLVFSVRDFCGGWAALVAYLNDHGFADGVTALDVLGATEEQLWMLDDLEYIWHQARRETE